MSFAELRSPYSSTSASDGRVMSTLRTHLLCGVLVAGIGTSATLEQPSDLDLRARSLDSRTTAGNSEVRTEEAGAVIAELRRLSGLTWDQLARLFNVSRRSLHFWASGKPSTPANEERLHRLVGLMRRIDRGSGAETRAALVTPLRDGTIPLDLLAEGRIDDVARLVGSGQTTARIRRPRISEEMRRARMPLPPHVLINALQDPVHIETGKARPAKVVRDRGGR